MLLGTLAAVGPLHAQSERPAKGPIRILVAVPPGGTSDIAARLIADSVAEALAQPTIVENKAGATGRIAAEALKNAAPDGTTFLVAPIAVTVLAPMVLKRLSYDPTKDFAPVSQIAKFQYAFAVSPTHPARTVPEFIAWAQANPGQANYGTPGAGSVPHYLGTLVGRETGVEMPHVPYRGAASLTTELMGGQVPCAISALSDLIELHRAGKVRIIATTGPERSPVLPAVLTFKEQGFPKVESVGWTGLYAPAGTAKPVVDQLAMAVANKLRTPAVRDKLAKLGLEPTGTSPEEFASIMAADTTRWAPIIKASGITVD
ncbi:Bug family tripartite tricarboxylate transporter substrate binding protein [Variovorax sp. LARHSF232]